MRRKNMIPPPPPPPRASSDFDYPGSYPKGNRPRSVQKEYRETIYPKKKPAKKISNNRPWRVEYNLVYDGGVSTFTQYYRTRFGALWSAFWNEHLRSSGGNAVLVYDESKRRLR